MVKTKKATKIRSLYESAMQKSLFDKTHENMSYSYEYVVQPQIEGWEEKEAMLLGKPEDDISGTTKAKVFDPRLSTISLERCARVMAQNPSGKSEAMSKDDRGKNMLMNLLISKWVLPNANSQFEFLIKSRLWDLYSSVYGVMFSLVDYVSKESYQGADNYLLPIRDCRPQPNRFSLNDADRFGIITWVTDDWLEARNKETWKNIDELLRLMKEGKVAEKGTQNAQDRSYIEKERQPNVKNDPNKGKIKLYTEYQRDRWITIAPDFDEKFVLRDIENPNGDESLPIVAKYCFPLMDSIYGLGEFERGKTLQYAINSLINLYLDGVAMSIFPPVIINPDSVVPSTIIDEPAARWLLSKNDPNAIQQPPRNPAGIAAFQSTYQFLLSSILNMSGTTDTTIAQSTDPTQGKTPQALKMMSSRENSRDAWDRFMMEKALEELMGKFVNLTANRMEKPVEMMLFKSEIEEIKKVYPDITELYTSGERGMATIDPKEFKDIKFNYSIVSGSTYKADQEKELANTQALLDFTVKNYQLLEVAFQQRGKRIDIAELYTRNLINSGTQDWDKIVVDIPVQQSVMGQSPMGQPQMGQPVGQPNVMPTGVPNTGQPLPQFQDPQIQQFAQQIFGPNAQNGQPIGQPSNPAL